MYIYIYIFTCIFTFTCSNIFRVNNKDTTTISGASIIKVYLLHKTITSQNVSSVAQVKNFFIS